jgi:hypothetical protein
MDLLVGMKLGAGTGGTLARMEITLRHGLTLPEVVSKSMSSYVVSKSMSSYQKPGT